MNCCSPPCRLSVTVKSSDQWILLASWKCSIIGTQTSQPLTCTRFPSGGWRFLSRALYLCLSCHRPLRTIRPPPPAIATELQWGELCQGAFGICARIAGSYCNLSWASPAALCGKPLILTICERSIPTWHHCRCLVWEEERVVGQEWWASTS